MRKAKSRPRARYWNGICIIAAVSIFGVMMACSGGGQNGGSNGIVVSINPSFVTVPQGGSQTFVATVSGTSNLAVTWSIQETAGGTINSVGAYSAGTMPGTYHIVATSAADQSKTATAFVTVPDIVVQVSPRDTTIGLNTTETYTATVTGTVNRGVNWTLQEGVAGGMITTGGVYTAPPVTGVFHVVATSQANSTKNAVTGVTVAPIVVTVFPSSDTLGPLGTRTFIANLTASVSAGTSWGVLEGASGGTVDGSGDYTAPTQQGGFHVVASSIADPTKSGSSSVSVVASGCRKTGNLSVARANHTASLLSDGKVLVAGGDSAELGICGTVSAGLSSSEIYDPVTGSFLPVADLHTGRFSHASVVLGNGKVLITGGEDGTNSLDSAELYDPASQGFSVMGRMTVPRDGHTSTLLANGKVLITGGFSRTATGSQILANAELYDPATGTFATTGDMSTGRSGHSATLLPDGTVLITGGDNLKSAELYDPSSGIFSPVGNMTEVRGHHTATLLADGSVLIAGGIGSNNGSPTTELYNSATKTFSAGPSMINARSYHTATLLANHSVLIVGGPDTYTTAELYDPVSKTFSATGSLAVGRAGHQATLLQDGLTVLITGGGSEANTPIAVAELYH